MSARAAWHRLVSVVRRRRPDPAPIAAPTPLLLSEVLRLWPAPPSKSVPRPTESTDGDS